LTSRTETSATDHVRHSEETQKDKEERVVKLAWIALIWGVLLAPILMTFAHPSTAGPAYYSPAVPVHHVPSGPLAPLLIFMAQYGLLFVGAAAILLAIRIPRPLNAGLGIWAGAMLMTLGPFMAMFFGTEPGLRSAVIRIPILFTAVFMLPNPGVDWFIRRCKGAIEFYTAFTFAALVVARDWVMSTGGSFIPGLDIRLHGIAGHANNFAIMLLVYLILGWIVPARSTRERFFLVMIVTALVLSQSKTILGVTVIIYLIRFFYLSGSVRFIAPYLAALGATIVAIVATAVSPQWPERLIDQIFTEDEVTLTGRTNVWSFTTELWRENPIFGHGVNLWNQSMQLDFAASYGWLPEHAHNQFYQTLGESGLVGVAGLIVFTIALVSYAIRYHSWTRGASIALVAALLIRAVTELSMHGDVGESFFAFFVTFAAFVLISVEVSETGRATTSIHSQSEVAEQKQSDQDRRLVPGGAFYAPSAGFPDRIRTIHPTSATFTGRNARS
jgi:exopolysaccharide production protein ExoQ